MAIDDEDRRLDAFLDAGRRAPDMSDDLVARMMADAFSVAAGRARRASPARRGLLRTVVDLVGGWPAMAGLATATVAGLWFGFTSPDLVRAYFGGSAGYDLGDLMPAMILADGG